MKLGPKFKLIMSIMENYFLPLVQGNLLSLVASFLYD
jgi:hypothetical protein